MIEVDIGITYHPKKGVSFFGAEEVNEHIRRGAFVVSIEPEGLITSAVDSDQDYVQVDLTGFIYKVALEEPKPTT